MSRSERYSRVIMRYSKVLPLLTHLFLAACTAPSIPPNSSIPTPSPSPTVSVAAKSLEPTPSTPPIKLTGAVDIDGIEPALIAKKAMLKIYNKIQSSQNCNRVMKYPQISGLADSAWQTRLNESLRQEMMRKMGVLEPMQEGDRCRNVTRNPGELFTLTAKCVVHFAEGRLVSISCSNFTMPGAYPQPSEHSITFDLATGKIYQVADLFQPESNYSVRLAVAMRDSLWERGYPNYIRFPFKELEAQQAFDYYLQEQCNEAFDNHNEYSRLGDFPTVCMVINNLGSGDSRNYKMVLRLNSMRDLIDGRGALKVLVEQIEQG